MGTSRKSPTEERTMKVMNAHFRGTSGIRERMRAPSWAPRTLPRATKIAGNHSKTPPMLKEIAPIRDAGVIAYNDVALALR